MLDSAGKVLLFLVGLGAGWVMILTFKSFWTQVKRMNEAIKKIIFGAAYPLITVTQHQARATGNYTDNFVARTVFDMYADHAQQEALREEQERFDHEVHPFIRDEQRLPTAYGTPEYNYHVENRRRALEHTRSIPGVRVDMHGRVVAQVTKSNCAHYWEQIQPGIMVCAMCHSVNTDNGVPHATASYERLTMAKPKPKPKTVAELRKSKTRSIILEKE